MHAFKFRLEKVLQVRQIMEEQEKEKWALQEKMARQEQAKLDYLLEEKSEIAKYGYEQDDFRIKKAMYNYLGILDRKIEKQKQGTTKSKGLAQQAKEQWLLARREEKKITILKEKHYHEYLQEKLRQEQKALDEMRRHLREN